jgi:hypothetical protein
VDPDIPRLVELTEPTVVGRDYLVPSVVTGGHLVPVMGSVHIDHELGPIACFPHIHVDQRFVDVSILHDLWGMTERDIAPNPATGVHKICIILADVIRGPVSEQVFPCLREMPHFKHHQTRDDGKPFYVHAGDRVDQTGAFEDAHEHRTLKACKVCPHQGIPLASMPVRDGVITCPGHMLDFDAATGKIIRRTVKNPDGTYRHAGT